MNNDPFLQLLGLARRAGKLLYGYDSVVSQKDSVSVVFTSNDLSEKTRKNLIYALESVKTVATDYDMNRLGYAIGTKPVGIVAVADEGFARLLIDKINKEVTE